jgi:hypothetical protein
VGLGRFELPTSRLSSARSNQLSYKPGTGVSNQKPAIRKRLITEYRLLTPEQLVREEREMKTAASCQWAFDLAIDRPDVSKRSDKDA